MHAFNEPTSSRAAIGITSDERTSGGGVPGPSRQAPPRHVCACLLPHPLRVGGGHNGHNGLKSIDKMIGKNYNRIRVGVSRPSKIYEENIDENISNWVLSDFTSNEKDKWLGNTINYVSEMIISLINSKNGFCGKNV